MSFFTVASLALAAIKRFGLLELLAVLAIVLAVIVNEAGWATPVVVAAMTAMERAPEPWPTIGWTAAIGLLALLAVGPLFMGFAMIAMRRRLR